MDTHPRAGRRQFFVRLGRSALGALVATFGHGRVAAALAWVAPDPPANGERAVPTPGFPVAPLTGEQRVMAALIDTVVPGAASDGGRPGALEAGALNLVYDTFYPVKTYVGLIVQLFQTQAQRRHGAAFEELDLPSREALLRATQGALPFLRHAYRFIRSTYLVGLHDAVGLNALGFPGPNLGYIHHPEFSFRRALSEEATVDGNLP